jgi:hypothetical protein
MRGEHGDRWSIYQCGYADLAAVLGAAGVKADALIVDAPYSAKTHKGHDDGTGAKARVRPEDERRLRVDKRNGSVYAVGAHRRRTIDFAHWTEDDVSHFVETFAGLVSGWWGSQTDHNLRGAWERALERAGLYTFAPLPCIESGGTVRMGGDGPPSWTTHLVTGTAEEPDEVSELTLARPRSETWKRWAVRVDREAREARPLPGYYLVKRERKPIVGGKPLELLRQIVGDYSAPGALVLDPCAGGGTTLVAAIQIGRRAIGCEPDAGRFNIAVERLRAAEKEITT